MQDRQYIRATWAILLWAWLALSPLAAQEFTSEFIPMTDGIRLAVDVHLPQDAKPGDKFPAILELTRYWRSAIDPETGGVVQALSPMDRGFLKRGYAIVKVDVRGSGDSFGYRLEEYGPSEVRERLCDCRVGGAAGVVRRECRRVWNFVLGDHG